MNCKFCGGLMSEDSTVCPVCGRENTPEAEEIRDGQVFDEFDEGVEIVPPETPAPDTMEQAEAVLAPEVKKMRRTAAISGCIAVLAVLAAVLFFGIRGTFNADGEGWNVAGWFDWEVFRKNDIQKKDSYTVDDSKAQNKADAVVATLGSAKLTNSQLQIYYQLEISEFLSYYGYYLSYVGLDETQPLDEQVIDTSNSLLAYFLPDAASLAEGTTWQQYFLENALLTWYQTQALALEAEKNGFVLDADSQTYLDSLETSLEELAAQYGYDSADAMVRAEFGENTALADWIEYMNVSWYGLEYFYELCQAVETPSDEELAVYFKENQQALEDMGIVQDGSYLVNVRHILVLPEGATVETIRTETFPEEAWEAARVKAQEILDAWYAGEATEDSFAALANAHSADTGSNTNGGLYEDVAVGEMVAEFDAWCFSSERQAGDVGLVKTDLGYHVMFFSARGEEVWLTQTREDYLSQEHAAILEENLEGYDMEVSYGKIALTNIELA